MKKIVLYFLIFISVMVLLVLYSQFSSYVTTEGFDDQVLELSDKNVDNLKKNLTNIIVADIVSVIKDNPVSQHPNISVNAGNNGLLDYIKSELDNLASYAPMDNYLTTEYMNVIKKPIHAVIDIMYPVFGESQPDKTNDKTQQEQYWKNRNTINSIFVDNSANIYQFTRLQFEFFNQMNILIHQYIESLFVGSKAAGLRLPPESHYDPVLQDGMYLPKADLIGLVLNTTNTAIESMDDFTTFSHPYFFYSSPSFGSTNLTTYISALIDMKTISTVPSSSSSSATFITPSSKYPIKTTQTNINQFVTDCQNVVKEKLFGLNDTMSSSLFPDIATQPYFMNASNQDNYYNMMKFRMKYFLDLRYIMLGKNSDYPMQSLYNPIPLDNFMNTVFSQNIVTPQPTQYEEGYVLSNSMFPDPSTSCKDGYYLSVYNLGYFPGQSYVCVNKEHKDLFIDNATQLVNATVK